MRRLMLWMFVAFWVAVFARVALDYFNATPVIYHIVGYWEGLFIMIFYIEYVKEK